MFGYDKEKIQLKSVEDYLKTQELLGSGSENGTTDGKRPSRLSKVKSIILPVVIILAILAAVAVAFFQMRELRAEVERLKAAQKEGDLKALKKQVADLTAQTDRSQRLIEELKDDTYGLRAEFEAQKAQAAKAAAAAAARKAAAKKKRVIGRRSRH